MSKKSNWTWKTEQRNWTEKFDGNKNEKVKRREEKIIYVSLLHHRIVYRNHSFILFHWGLLFSLKEEKAKRKY